MLFLVGVFMLTCSFCIYSLCVFFLLLQLNADLSAIQSKLRLSLAKNVVRLYWACIISHSISIGVELELTSWTAWTWIRIDNLIIVLNNFRSIDNVFNDDLNNTIYGLQVTTFGDCFLCFVTSKVKIKFELVEQYCRTVNNPMSNPSCIPPISWNYEHWCSPCIYIFSHKHPPFLSVMNKFQNL